MSRARLLIDTRLLLVRRSPRGSAAPLVPGCLVLILLIISGLVGCGGAKETPRSGQTDVPDHKSPDAPVDDAAALLKAGKLDEADRAARRVLMENPGDLEATLTAARIEAARGNHRDAADLAASIPLGSNLGREAMEFRLQELNQLGALDEATSAVLAALEEMPHQMGLRHLAWAMLNRAGRREEASLQVDSLCRLGEATDAEMLSLIRRTDAFPPQLKEGENPSRHFAAGLGMARWHFTNLDYRQALQELTPQAEAEFESAAACALYGRLLAETQAFEQVPVWHARCDADVKVLGDYWAALGTYFFDRRQFEASARALMEALYRNPTDRVSMQRLSKVFAALGRRDDEEQFRHRAILMATLERDSEALMRSRSDLKSRQLLTRKVLELGRPFEALAWTLSMIPNHAIVQRNQVAQQRKMLLANEEALTMASESALIGVDPSQFEIEPALAAVARKSIGSSSKAEPIIPDEPLAKPQLVNVASQRGLDFQWYTDLEISVASIPIHESVGGGIAVLDYDLDGWPDVYLAQGSGEPPSDQCTRSNEMFRNQDSAFVPVTASSNALDFNYGSGLTAGDVNQDGFADLMLGSLGHNRLLVNNGDGTFHEATDSLGDVADRFTSSLALADISGDGIPDLFEAVYIEMEGAFKLPDVGPDGREKQPSPLAHYAESDRWFENLGLGQFRVHEIDRTTAKPGTSLGVIVTDFDDDRMNEIFVGNDVRPNHFLLRDASGELQNAADIKGVANGYSGSATGCMGITHGDFNHDGRIDLHITNFSEESANLYVQVGSGEFSDLAVRYGIDQISLPYVGFGTKAIDIDRNGWLDLLVTNGHIFDMRFVGEAFQMPPQFLYGRSGRFELAPVDDPSGYWEGSYLGRAMAQLDFNRDGAIDVLIGHLEKPVALLENRTTTTGNWIQLELVGTLSERDAIGTRVVVTAGGNQFSNWVTAGDGYFCSDEPVLDFGLGKTAQIEKVEIQWPSGVRQTLREISSGKRYVVVENSNEFFLRL